MRLRKEGRGEGRRWKRRLVDYETRDFIDEFLEETRDVFRRSSGEIDLRALTEDVFSSQPTTDLRWLRRRGVEPGDFYERELAPNWEGLEQPARAGKIEQFMRLSNSLGAAHDGGGNPPETVVDMIATVHTKVLLLAWAHDRTYSYIDRIVSNPAQFGAHEDVAEGR